MRPKFVFGAIAAALLFLGVVYFVSQTTRPSVDETQSRPAADLAHLPTGPGQNRRVHAVRELTNSKPATEPQSEIAEIDTAMLQVGEQTLPLLCGKLSAPDRQVRQAAVSNLVILADREAIPALTEAASRATDAEEKTNLLKAIEFLQLPTYDELVANGTMQPLGKVSGAGNRSESERYSPVTNPKPPPSESK
jgi:hypothetical protein